MHHLVQNQPKLATVNQAQSLKTISIVARILVSTWACMLKKKKRRTHTNILIITIPLVRTGQAHFEKKIGGPRLQSRTKARLRRWKGARHPFHLICRSVFEISTAMLCYELFHPITSFMHEMHKIKYAHYVIYKLRWSNCNLPTCGQVGNHFATCGLKNCQFTLLK